MIAKKARLQHQIEELGHHKSNMDDANEIAGSVSTYSTPSECLNMKDVIKRRLKDLIEKPFDTTPHDNADIKVITSGTFTSGTFTKMILIFSGHIIKLLWDRHSRCEIFEIYTSY